MFNHKNFNHEKKKLKALKLNKKSVSNLNEDSLKGGNTALCTGLAGSCWCLVTITDCCVKPSRGWCNHQ